MRQVIPVSAELLRDEEYLKSRAELLAGRPIAEPVCVECPRCQQALLVVDEHRVVEK